MHRAVQKGESELLNRLREVLPAPSRGIAGAVPFGDDMAALPDGPTSLLWATDMLMDGVDFISGVHPWRRIGRKAMAANLSDCAAMAVRPVAALCAVALNDALSMEDAVELHRGAHELGMRYGCPIVGGDTNGWNHPTVIAISIAARAEPGLPPVRRDGGRPGDGVYLTGPVGGSILGRHLTFEPRVELAIRVARELRPHAMIDISDGFALDLSRVLTASGCGAALDETALDAAIHPDARALAATDGASPRAHALQDGEDFELIVLLPPEIDAVTAGGLGLIRVGDVTAKPGLRLRTADGSESLLEPGGWEHFR